VPVSGGKAFAVFCCAAGVGCGGLGGGVPLRAAFGAPAFCIAAGESTPAPSSPT
jgi:hypothetical protein